MLTPTVLRAARYLDLLSAAQRVTAENIANADTPGYRARRLDFAAALEEALERPSRAPLAEPAVVRAGGAAVKNDGNDVDLDRELRALAEHSIRFQQALQTLRAGLATVRKAIQEGRTG